MRKRRISAPTAARWSPLSAFNNRNLSRNLFVLEFNADELQVVYRAFP